MFVALLIFMWACMGGFMPTGPINGPCGGGGSGRPVPVVPDSIPQ